MTGRRKFATMTLIAVALMIVECAACSSSHHASAPPSSAIGLPGRTTDADRAACAALGAAMRLGDTLRLQHDIAVADVRTSWRTALAAGGHADDPKLRASVTSYATYALGDGRNATQPDPFYPVIRCSRIDRALPVDVGVVPLGPG